jgi:hypothetical protein
MICMGLIKSCVYVIPGTKPCLISSEDCKLSGTTRSDKLLEASYDREPEFSALDSDVGINGDKRQAHCTLYTYLNTNITVFWVVPHICFRFKSSEDVGR